MRPHRFGRQDRGRTDRGSKKNAPAEYIIIKTSDFRVSVPLLDLSESNNMNFSDNEAVSSIIYICQKL